MARGRALAPVAVSAGMGRSIALPGLDAGTYRRHDLHAEQQVWVEKNCYVDIWIEVLHALRLDPVAVMPFALAIDFEGDQWTFIKPPHGDLRALYGLDVQELNVWRPLIEHAAEHLGAGKLLSTEADAFWLPDTAGTDYRRQHSKTTIVLNALDLERQRLGYFHNAGYFELEGEDFARTFRVGAPPDPTFMPLFAETVRVDRVVHRPTDDLRQVARRLLARHIERRPTTNPLRRFQERFERELPLMQQRELGHYHQWAFATIRQLGAAFELAATHVRWVWPEGSNEAESIAKSFSSISAISKTLILKAARSVNSRRAFDAAPLFDEMAAGWEGGTKGAAQLLSL